MKFYLDDDFNSLVVIPSLNSNLLKDSLNSVLKQTRETDILVVFDGPVSGDLSWIPDSVHTMTLPWNTGANGFYGHRIYSMIGHLAKQDFIFFLDEDNFYEPNHIETCLSEIGSDHGFIHSYRNIVDKSGEFVCRDTFEAIGADPINLVDTSSYCFRREFLIGYGHLWNYGWGADRRFFQIIKQNNLTKFSSTEKFTVNYRLDGNPGSPTKEFFESGNIKNGYNKAGTRPNQQIV